MFVSLPHVLDVFRFSHDLYMQPHAHDLGEVALPKFLKRVQKLDRMVTIISIFFVNMDRSILHIDNNFVLKIS